MSTVAHTTTMHPFDDGNSPSRTTVDSSGIKDALVRALLDEIDFGVLACTAGGGLVWANHAARRELNVGEAIFLVDGRLQSRGSASLGAALQRAASAGKRQLMTVGTAGELMVSLLPLRTAADDRQVHVGLVMGRRHAVGDLSMQMLATLYALSRAERLVLTGLARGQSPSDMARERNIAISTVRTQIATVRRKCGAESIGDLVRLVARMPPMTSALRCC